LDEVCAVGVVWSVTVTVKVVVASADVGVPLIRPLVPEKFKPVGKVPPDSTKLSAPVPPEAVTGVNEAAAPAVKVVLGTACVVVSAGVTVRVADVPVVPVAAPLALGVPVGMILDPEVLGVTSTLNVQVPLAPSAPPLSDSDVVFAAGENVPPQVVMAFGVDATARLLGSVTLSATPVNPTALFGLVRVKVRVLVPPTMIVVGLAATVAVGAAGGGSVSVSVQGVSVMKSSLESQKNWLNAAVGEPSVELTVISMLLKDGPAASGWLKVTLAWPSGLVRVVGVGTYAVPFAM
jgi:hypothetical protein